MKKFWDWMKFKKVVLSDHVLSYVSTKAFVIEESGVIYKGSQTDHAKLPEEMLIGYMIEYLFDQGINFDLSNSSHFGLEDVYEYLEYLINEPHTPA